MGSWFALRISATPPPRIRERLHRLWTALCLSSWAHRTFRRHPWELLRTIRFWLHSSHLRSPYSWHRQPSSRFATSPRCRSRSANQSHCWSSASLLVHKSRQHLRTRWRVAPSATIFRPTITHHFGSIVGGKARKARQYHPHCQSFGRSPSPSSATHSAPLGASFRCASSLPPTSFQHPPGICRQRSRSLFRQRLHLWTRKRVVVEHQLFPSRSQRLVASQESREHELPFPTQWQSFALHAQPPTAFHPSTHLRTHHPLSLCHAECSGRMGFSR